MIELMPHQEEAVSNLDTGKILWGGVGSGKSLAVLAYYAQYQSGKDIIVITTAKKRDSLEWEGEAAKLGISTSREFSRFGLLTVESWNNLYKFRDTRDAFFVFDEQRVVGTGSWVKSFIHIARQNDWILLSATPGDNWLDYAPVFIANGYYKNISQFKLEHVVYEAFAKYPKVKMYLNESKLEQLRNIVLVEMPFLSHTERVVNYLDVGYDRDLFREVVKDRWHVYEDRPITDVSEMFRLMRKVVNSDPSRLETIKFLMVTHPRLVIFYSFNYELEILRTLSDLVEVKEWNGHRKDPLPQGENWVYLVQYASGAEGWNCTTTDAMVLYSLTYSYKNFMQAQGRIDRLDTPYVNLYYYVLVSNSLIDVGIRNSLQSKENFNERKYAWKMGKISEFA